MRRAFCGVGVFSPPYFASHICKMASFLPPLTGPIRDDSRGAAHTLIIIQLAELSTNHNLLGVGERLCCIYFYFIYWFYGFFIFLYCQENIEHKQEEQMDLVATPKELYFSVITSCLSDDAFMIVILFTYLFIYLHVYLPAALL